MSHLSSSKAFLFVSGPPPHFSFFGELVKGFGYVQKVLDESPIEIDKPNEQLTSVTFLGVGQSRTPATLTDPSLHDLLKG